MYLSEGGVASSGRAAQFMKALTLMVWRVIGRLTSLRLVQCTKVNSCLFDLCVGKVNFLEQVATVCSHGCKTLREC